MEWHAFHDAFCAAVGSNKSLTNVQKFTHLRSCLEGKAYRCIQGYSVTKENYEKALEDLNNRFGRKRLIVTELVKSIVNLSVSDQSDAKTLRFLLDTLRNRIR